MRRTEPTESRSRSRTAPLRKDVPRSIPRYRIIPHKQKRGGMGLKCRDHSSVRSRHQLINYRFGRLLLLVNGRNTEMP